MGFICRCFYEKNIYLKDFGLHVIFVGDENEFRRRYGEVLSSELLGGNMQQWLDALMPLGFILTYYDTQTWERFRNIAVSISLSSHNHVILV